MPFEIVNYDYIASMEYGKIRANLEKKGQVIGNMDMQIAGHALALDLILVAHNARKFERVEGLELEKWRLNGRVCS